MRKTLLLQLSPRRWESALSVGILVCALGGCPQNGPDDAARSTTEISPSNIPAGIYSGDVAMDVVERINGDILSSNSLTANQSISFGDQGIPLDYASGEAERPGLFATEQYGAFSVSGTTETVTVAGDRVTVIYRDTMTLEVPGYGDITLSGTSEVVYTLSGDSCVDFQSSMTCGSEPLEGIGYYTVTATSQGTLCLGNDAAPEDDARQSPPSDQMSCPFTLDDDPAYSVVMPCGTIRAEPSHEIPGATFESYFLDEAWQQVYIVATVPIDSLVQTSGSSTPFGIAWRWDGTMRSNSGDLVVLATGRLASGAVLTYGYCALQDGRLLMLGTDSANPLALSFFGSIDLAGTTGDVLLSPPPGGYPILMAPAPDGVVLLSDSSVYRVSGSDLQKTVAWQTGASIIVNEASSYFTYSPFYLTNRSEWVSVPAHYVTIATQSTIENIEQPEYSSTIVELANGAVWRVAFSDEATVNTWALGAPVAVFDDPGSFLSATMLHLPTGRAVSVEPG